jgi:hypothetical protein
MAAAKTIAVPRWLVIIATLVGAAGCMNDRHPQIPADATLMTEGQKSLTFRATEPGIVYVYNRNDNKMVYSGEMERGQSLSVDPDRNRITIDGRTVLEKGLDANETLRVFFKPSVLPRERVIIEEHHDVR